MVTMALSDDVVDPVFVGIDRKFVTQSQRAAFFPDLLVEMTSVGDETGSLEETLHTIGEYYDSETEIASDHAVRVMQPVITLVMGFVIGFIVIALYLPMFNMGMTIG